ncbi:hypothetical protein CALCODRAFT_186039 [Calocera cornea HHB12733]|uniref:Uncharacterized protein n=1 Tax=Calocera cornea HHB12733 TaxID=1353952 RepID=A0A165HP42_9BASI|nr:hypothetical protein CALCODRAFT_186039 [Calocera cornea HHB12733]
MLLDGKRMVTSPEEQKNKSDSLVLAQIRRGLQWVGELREVLQHTQPGIDVPHTFAVVAWLVPLPEMPNLADLYQNLPELEVEFWRHRQYQPLDDLAPDPLVLADDIAGVAARCEMEIEGETVWVTTGMSQVSPVDCLH